MQHRPGINLYEKRWENLTRNKAFEKYTPDKVVISMNPYEAQICRSIVKPGESVVCGQVIGRSDAPLQLLVHASISGIVEKITTYQKAPGISVEYVHILRKQVPYDDREEIDFYRNIKYGSFQIEATGVNPEKLKPASAVLINGFANEPYITSGYRLALECASKIVIGAVISSMIAQADQIYLCVNEDAFDVMLCLERAKKKYAGIMDNQRPICLIPMKHRYPNGKDALIADAIPDPQIKKSSIDIITMQEAAAIYDTFFDGRPWVETGVTVSGNVPHPKNLWVPFGTSVDELITFCGGKKAADVIVEGGPLSGHTVDGKHAWVTKETSGILVLKPHSVEAFPCFQCGRCREVCPAGLKPDLAERWYLNEISGAGISMDASKCLRCGLCSYVCPSGRRLAEHIHQLNKGKVKKTDSTNKAGAYIELDPDTLPAMNLNSESPPHIRCRGTICAVMKHSIFALIPIILMLCLSHPSGGLRLITGIAVGASTAVLSEYLWQRGHGMYVTIRDLSACFSGMLAVLIIPADAAYWRIAFGVAIAVMVGKQIPGGIGHAIIHPAMLARFLIAPFSVPVMEAFWPAALAGCLWMIISRMCIPVYALVYLMITIICYPENVFHASIYVAAAWLVMSYEVMPLERNEKYALVVFAAVLTVIFEAVGMGASGIYLALGIAQVLYRGIHLNFLPFYL